MDLCSECGAVLEGGTSIVKMEETFPVKGEPTTISSIVRVCNGCDAPVYDRELDSANLSKAFDLYRTKHGIISPAEIKSLREIYGLSQRDLSSLLGMGGVTIHRYESGSIPDEVHNQLLVMLQDPRNMGEILKKCGGSLADSKRKKMTVKVEEAIREEASQKILELAVAKIDHKGADIYTGYLSFQPEKLMEMIVFLTQGAGVYKTKLNKLLWYSDFLHYRYFGVSISGSSYVHLPFGPCADRYDFFLLHLIEEKKLKSTEVFWGNGSGEQFSALKEANDSFALSEIEIMKAASQYFCNDTSKSISDISHAEKGYSETSNGDLISYAYADKLKVDLTPLIPSLGE